MLLKNDLYIFLNKSFYKKYIFLVHIIELLSAQVLGYLVIFRAASSLP